VIEKEVEIVNRLGLHARAAAKLVHAAGRYHSAVSLIKDGDEVDGKSILGVLMLAAGKGSTVTVRCEGADEEDALDEITGLIRRGFEEGADRR
jgi:phosphotransferase system HPr (HPr) family protein